MLCGSIVSPAPARWGSGFRRPLLLAAAITLAGTLGILVAPAGAIACAICIGFGTSIAFTLGLAAPAELAPRDRVGAAAGILLAIGYFGSMPGPFV